LHLHHGLDIEDLLRPHWTILLLLKVHTLDIAPLIRSESQLQKRSGMARVLKGFHSFTCTPTRSSAIGMSHEWDVLLATNRRFWCWSCLTIRIEEF